MIRVFALSTSFICMALVAGCGGGAPEPGGPACPATQPAENGGALKPTNVMEFDGMSFARKFGDAGCEYEGRDPVCTFSSPAVLEVKTPKGTYVFAPGIGQPAKVTVREGVAACEITPKT